MKKSQLKEVIQNVVARKLAESAGQKPAKYGYVLADKNTDDPRLQMIGYGNMPKSYWKKKILRDLDELKKYAEEENWNACAHLVEKNGVLYSMINMMKEVFEGKLKEQLAFDNETAKDKPEKNPVDLKNQEKLASLKKTQSDLRDKIGRIDAKKQELEDPIRRKVQDLDRKKAPEIKRIGAITKQIQDLEKKA